MKYILIGILVLILSKPVFTEIRTLTLSNSIELALMNNLDISRAKEEMGVAEAQYAEARADLTMPSIYASAGYTVLDPDTVKNGMMESFELTKTPNPALGGLPIEPDVLTNIYTDNYKTGISIVKPIFAGFRLLNSLNIKQANLDLVRARLNDTKREIASRAAVSFYNLFLIKENIKMTEDLNRGLKESAEYTRKNYLAGNAMEYDSIRADVQYKNNLAVLLQVSNSYITSKLAFCQQIGIADPSSVEFVGSLYDTTNIILFETNTEKLISMALSNNILLKNIEIDIKIYSLQGKLVEAGNMPSLSAFFNFNYNYEKTNASIPIDRAWNSSWNTGLQLTIPIDSLIPVVSRNWNNRIEIEKNIKILEIQKHQIYDTVSLQVQSLLIQIGQSHEDIKSRENNEHQAQLGYKLADERYKAGISSEFEVIDAEAAMSQAQAGYLGAVLEYYTGMLRMKRLIGE